MNRQQMIAQALRGQRNTGAMLAPSQIAEVSKMGNDAIASADDMAMGIGDNLFSAQEAEKDREQRRMEGRKDRALRKTLADQAVVNDAWKATKTEREDILDAESEVAGLFGMSESFKDTYGSETFGPLERGIQTAMTYFPKYTGKASEMLGHKSTKDLKEERAWWSAYERFNKIPERANIFGATLTTNEQGSWEAAEINPGMEADQIRQNLKIREKIARDALNRMVDRYEALGLSPRLIAQIREGVATGAVDQSVANTLKSELAQRGTSVEELNASVQNGANSPSEGGSAQVGAPPEGVAVEEWQNYSPSDRKEVLDYIEQYGALP